MENKLPKELSILNMSGPLWCHDREFTAELSCVHLKIK
jgi:hypothetical protein